MANIFGKWAVFEKIKLFPIFYLEVGVLNPKSDRLLASNPRPGSNPSPVVDSITSPATINFNKGESATPTVVNPLVNGQAVANIGMTFSAYSGFANNAPIAGGSCSGIGASGCYYEDGMVVGIVQDTSDVISHLHRGGTTMGLTQDTSLKYHSDSSGVYVRALNSQAFSLQSMGFSAPISAENPIYGANPTHDVDGIIQPDGAGVLGPNEYWEILGYDSAVNPGLDTSVNGGEYIAKQAVANGFDGLLTLSSAFNNIKAFWIHYHGYQQSPKDGMAFAVELDNIKVAPVAPVTTANIAEQTAWDSALQSYKTTYSTTTYDPGLALLTKTYNSNLALLTNSSVVSSHQLNY